MELRRYPDADSPWLLDEPLVVEFDRPLARGILPGCFSVKEVSSGDSVQLEMEVSGRSLLFKPVPPCMPSMQDGSFRPGETYLLRLHGLPRLASIQGEDGTPLVGDRLLQITCIDNPSEDWLQGDGIPGAPIRVLLSRSGVLLEGRGDQEGYLRMPLSGVLDPRSLQPARLHSGAREEPLKVPLQLACNRSGEVVLVADLRQADVPGLLELPRELCGPASRRLALGDRQIQYLPSR